MLTDDDLLADRRSRRPSASSRWASCCAAASASTRCTTPADIDAWFLDQMLQIVDERAAFAELRHRTA